MTHSWILAAALATVAPVVSQAETRADEWQGLYGGASLGVTSSEGAAELGNFDGDIIRGDVEAGLVPQERGAHETGAAAGLALGYNVQNGAFVGGVELDWSGPGSDTVHRFESIDRTGRDLFHNQLTKTRFETNFNGLATARLRAGYATGPTLVYVTGGLAASRVANDFDLDVPDLVVPGLLEDGYASPGNWRSSGTRYGYVVGAGVERKLSQRFSLKSELMYFDLSDARAGGDDPGTFPDERIDYEFENDGFMARIGVNYAF